MGTGIPASPPRCKPYGFCACQREVLLFNVPFLMLGKNEDAVIALLGSPLGTARPRYRCDRALAFLNASLRAEVGFLRGEAVYAIFRKRSGGRFQPMEVEALLYSIGSSAEWEVRQIPSGPGVSRTARARKEVAGNSPNVMDYVYKERRSRTAPIQKILFAQLHAAATQVAVFRADWLPDLEELERTPLK